MTEPTLQERCTRIRRRIESSLPMETTADVPSYPEVIADIEAISDIVGKLGDVVAAARAWDFAHRNPYQLNMPACEKRLRDALRSLDEPDEDTPTVCPTCGNQKGWPVLAEQGRFREELRSCPDSFHTPTEVTR